MQDITIDNALLTPIIAQGWVFRDQPEGACLDNRSLGRRLTLDDIATMIVSLCDGSRNLAEIIEQLCSEFPNANKEIPDDVESVIRHLNQSGAFSFAPHTAQKVFEIPTITPVLKESKKLCVAMATYDDYDGVYFSIQSIRLFHPEVSDDIEFVVLDNHPDGPCSQKLKELEHHNQNYRYVPLTSVTGPWARYNIPHYTNAQYILCIDSHVMIQPGAIRMLIEYFEANPDTPDLLQGPLLGDGMRSLSTHFNPIWSTGMYGTWAFDQRAAKATNPPFDIKMQGMGLFAFNRNRWPGINSRFHGFGAEEGYVQKRIRNSGGRSLCLPFLRWLHRFNRPMGPPYTIIWADRIRNYLIGRHEFSLDYDDVVEHFREHLGKDITDKTVANTEAEFNSPFYPFDAIICLVDMENDQHLLTAKQQFKAYEILHRVEFIQYDNSGADGLRNELDTLKSIFNKAIDLKYKNLVVFRSDRIDMLSEQPIEQKHLDSVLMHDKEMVNVGCADSSKNKSALSLYDRSIFSKMLK